MSADFSIGMGKENVAGDFKSEELKGGIKRENINEKYKSLFDALDNGNNILEDSEVNKLKTIIKDAAAKDGDVTNLSNKEAKSILKQLNIKNLKVDDLFDFINAVKTASVNVDYCVGDAESGDIVIAYKKDNDGVTKIERHDQTTGELNKVFESHDDAKEGKVEYHKDPDGKIIGGKNSVGEFNRTYDDNGGYTDTYPDRTRTYDKDGRWINGVTTDGRTYTREYDEQGGYKETYDDGEIQNYDKDGKLISGTTKNGITYEVEYDSEGNYVIKYSDGEIANYDEDGRVISGTLKNGITYEVEYDSEGNYVKKYSDGEIANYDEDGRVISGTTKNGITYEVEYDSEGNYVKKYSNGETQNYNKDGKLINGKLGNGTTFEVIYNEDGSRKYHEYTRKDGSKYYWGPNHTYAEKTQNGNMRAYAKEGENFDATMQRLGITDPEDQKIFRAANPKAAQRGYFLVGKLDVYIPKSIADKLDISNILVDGDAETKKWQEAIKPKMGV